MIDYSETRGISEETLNELLQELNPDFIKKLPDTPQEILIQLQLDFLKGLAYQQM